MSCEINITSVLSVGSAGSTPASLVIAGTATECASVAVTFGCINSFTLIVPVDAAGNWKATFADHAMLEKSGCKCGSDMLIVVACTSDPNCIKRFPTRLDCKPVEGCPAVSINVLIGECRFDQTRSITLTATVAAGVDAVFAQWQHEGGIAGTAFAVAAGTTTTSAPEIIAYPDGTHVSKLRIISPSGCPDHLISIDVPPCPVADCPEVVGLVAKVTGCAGAGENATVTFSGTLSPAGTGCSFQWDFGDGSPEVTTSTPTVSHVYTAPGTYAVAVTAICGPCIRTTTVSVIVPPCCAVVTGITATIEGCADGANSSATVTLVATTDPTPAPGTYRWTFGDGSPEVSTTAPTVTHVYTTPGSKTVQVTYTPSAAGCPPDVESATVTVPDCSPTNPDGGEGFSCRGLRWAGVIALILSALALYICMCVPGVGSGFCILSGLLALLAAVLLGIWFFFCPKPCGAALLLLWQVALGTGIGALYFAPCCPSLLPIGIGLILAGFTGLALWRTRCKKNFCQVAAELAVVVTVVIVPVLNWVGLVPALSACLNSAVVASVAALSAAIAAALANCAVNSGE